MKCMRAECKRVWFEDDPRMGKQMLYCSGFCSWLDHRTICLPGGGHKLRMTMAEARRTYKNHLIRSRAAAKKIRLLKKRKEILKSL